MADESSKFKQQKKDQLEMYQTQKRIEDSVKKTTDSWSKFGDIQKSIVKNAKEIAETEKEIARLTREDSTPAEKERGEELKKQIEYLKEQNKQLGSFKTLLHAGVKAGLKGVTDHLKNAWELTLKLDKAAVDVTKSIGLTGRGFESMYGAIRANEGVLAEWGMDLEEAAKMQSSFANETGRQVVLGEKSAEAMVQTAKAAGMGAEEMATLTGQMEAFGLGAIQASDVVMEVRDMSETMGVNAGKVIKKFQQNLGMLNKLNFKGGMKSMGKMAAHSEKFKLSMESVASVAEKVWNPEGAIEAAAHLQTLGGGLAQLGDPFQLMFKARNAPEELAKSLTKAAKSSAVFNKATGEFEVNALELSRLREAAEALGMDYTELVQTAKQGAKLDMLGSMLKAVPKEHRDMIAGMAQMGKNGAATITFKGGDGKMITKNINDLTGTEAKLIADRKTEREAQASEAMAIQDEFNAIKNLMMKAAVNVFDPLVEWLKDDGAVFIETLKGMGKWLMEFVVSIPNSLKLFLGGLIAFGPLLATIFGPLKWFLHGKFLGRGFDAQQKASGFLKGITGGKQSVAGGGGLTQDKAGKWRNSKGQFAKAPKAPKGGAATQTMGRSAGGQAGNFLKGAVGLLAIAAALFVFAKALQEFEKLQDGWGTLFLAAGSLIALGGALAILQPVLNSFGTTAWIGIAAMGALAGSMVLLGVAMQLMEGAGWGAWGMMALSLGLVIGAVAILGSLASTGVGFLGVALMLGIGAAMIMMGAAVFIVAAGMTMLVDSITRLFSGDALTMEKAGAFFVLAAGIGALAVSLMLMGASALGAVIAIGILGSLSYIVISTAEALANVDFGGMATEIQNIGAALSGLDTEKMDSLKNAAFWLMAAGLKPVQVEFSTLNINGTIDLKGEGGSTEVDLSSSIFVSELKNMIFDAFARDRNGGQLQG